MQSDINEVEKSALVIRLERNQKDLLQLKTQLSSYICEPRTYQFFVRIETLRDGLDNLSATNSEIIASLKERKRVVKKYVKRAKKLLLDFNQLQQGVDDYIAGARSC